jgi:UDP-glucose 4-epimerase
MRVLVTGGAGFIASHVVDAYVERGHEVTVIDDLSSGLRENVNPKAELVVADLRQPQTVESLRGRKFDLVNHHAAQIDVRVSVADPAADAELNVVAALRLFQAMIDDGVKKIVFASSGGAAYGEPQYAPQDEQHPVNPLSPYGCAKLAIDQYLGFFRAVHGVKAVSLRYGNVYGPRQRKDGEAGVVAIFAGALLEGQKARINGTGEQTRDYVYVEDVARANVLALEGEAPSGAYNIGTGIETSVNGLYEALREISGKGLPAEYAPARPGEQLRSSIDPTKASKALNWYPQNALTTALKETLRYFGAL